MGRPAATNKDDTAVQHCRMNRDGPKNTVPSWRSASPGRVQPLHREMTRIKMHKWINNRNKD